MLSVVLQRKIIKIRNSKNAEETLRVPLHQKIITGWRGWHAESFNSEYYRKPTFGALMVLR